MLLGIAMRKVKSYFNWMGSGCLEWRNYVKWYNGMPLFWNGVWCFD